MKEWLAGLHLDKYFTADLLVRIAVAALTLLVGWTIARLISSGFGKILERRSSPQTAMIFRRTVFYALLGIVLASALHQTGFKLGVLLGAAGVLTVAVGFASQTSASNLISGLFVIAERPFVVGDIIQVENMIGKVLSIDLLSVKIRTFDNLYIRIPNEQIIKSPITNLTHFPIRRIDVQVGVAYKEDLAQVKRILFEVADKNPLCLEEPKPLYIFKGYGDSSLNIQFSVWAKRENYLDLLNSIHEDIKAAFDAAGIEIPFPHRTLYTGAATDPFPVRVVGGEPGAGLHEEPGAESS
jgi:small-conductance mechanosensitive channel